MTFDRHELHQRFMERWTPRMTPAAQRVALTILDAYWAQMFPRARGDLARQLGMTYGADEKERPSGAPGPDALAPIIDALQIMDDQYQIERHGITRRLDALRQDLDRATARLAELDGYGESDLDQEFDAALQRAREAGKMRPRAAEFDDE